MIGGSEAEGMAAAQRRTPVRGTQSLVGVMGAVWKQPSLTALEVGWRWLAALPLLWLLWRNSAAALQRVALNKTGLESLTFLEPVRSAGILAQQGRLYAPLLRHAALVWGPLAVCVWGVLAALGRTAVLRRAEPALQPRLAVMTVFALARGAAFLLLLVGWLAGCLEAVRFTVIRPGQQGAEPNVVLLTALAVGLTLAAFLIWSLLVWLLDLPPLQAMAGTPVPGAPQRQQLRSKLIETNLVMGIVRVALLVLAMTFSASPLPFQSQETQGFITFWWIGVGVLYLFASDFFHVVRRVTYLRLLESVASETNEERLALL